VDSSSSEAALPRAPGSSRTIASSMTSNRDLAAEQYVVAERHLFDTEMIDDALVDALITGRTQRQDDPPQRIRGPWFA
jgi:hypothetical protein